MWKLSHAQPASTSIQSTPIDFFEMPKLIIRERSGLISEDLPIILQYATYCSRLPQLPLAAPASSVKPVKFSLYLKVFVVTAWNVSSCAVYAVKTKFFILSKSYPTCEKELSSLLSFAFCFPSSRKTPMFSYHDSESLSISSGAYWSPVSRTSAADAWNFFLKCIH